MKQRRNILTGILGTALVLSLAGCGTDTSVREPEETAAAAEAAETANTETADTNTAAVTTNLSKIDASAWQYNEADDVYYQIGISYCETPADENYETLAVFVPGAYMNAADNGDGTYTCEINTEAEVNGYTAETPVFEPSTITVTGPEAYLKDISYAWVTFGQNVIVDSSYSIETNFTLMNEDGDAVSTEYLTLSQDTIRATLPILQVKNVPLEVDVIEGAGASKANTKISIEPNTVTLAGDSSILSGMNKIVLDTIDLTDFSSTLTETYPIAINNELRNVTGVTEAKVTLEVVGLETRSFRVSNLSYINSADGTNVEILTEGLDVQIRGTAEQLDLIK